MDINILYASNDNYAKLMGISMLSLLSNKNTGDTVNFYILNDKISGQNKLKLRGMVKEHDASIGLYDISGELASFLNNKAGLWLGGATALARFFLGDFLPHHIKRVLYLDCDTLINGPLNDILNMDMRGKTAAMGYDCIRNEFKKSIGLNYDEPYYNSGIILVDIAKWREHNYKEKLLKYIVSHKESKLPDQDALNLVLKNDIEPLDVRYNFFSMFFYYHYNDILAIYRLNETYWYKKNDFYEGRENIVIYHFCGNIFGRPWYKNSEHPIKPVYDNYYYSSPWADMQIDYKKDLRWKIVFFLDKHFPAFVSVSLQSAMQRFFVFLHFKV